MRFAVELGDNVILMLDEVALVTQRGTSLKITFRGSPAPLEIESASEKLARERYELIRGQFGFPKKGAK